MCVCASVVCNLIVFTFTPVICGAHLAARICPDFYAHTSQHTFRTPTTNTTHIHPLQPAGSNTLRAQKCEFHPRPERNAGTFARAIIGLVHARSHLDGTISIDISHEVCSRRVFLNKGARAAGRRSLCVDNRIMLAVGVAYIDAVYSAMNTVRVRCV